MRPSTPRERVSERAMESVIERGAGKPSLTQLFYLKCCVEDKQLFPARLSECGRQLSERGGGGGRTDKSFLQPQEHNWRAEGRSGPLHR